MSREYRCPACAFRVFNRRLKRCEKCGAALPAELQYSAQELARLEADRRENEASLERTREKRDVAYGDSTGGFSGDFGGDFGGGDGGDCGGGAD